MISLRKKVKKVKEEMDKDKKDLIKCLIRWGIVVLAIIIFIIAFFVSAYKTRDTYISMYNQAVELEEQGKYTDAYAVYTALYMKTGDYKDIVQRMYGIKEYNYYSEAIELETNGKYFDAMKIFIKIIDFQDAEDHFDNCARLYLENK